MPENPFTHTQFKDTDGVSPCAPGEHDYITVDPDADCGDEDFDGPMICRYCGTDDLDDDDFVARTTGTKDSSTTPTLA